jgi:hypothetical protein
MIKDVIIDYPWIVNLMAGPPKYKGLAATIR